MATSKKSSNKWMQRHLNCPYVKQAQLLGYRSRASFKLLEIQNKDKIIKPGMRVIDLGSAPGGWAQVAADLVGKNGSVIALDLLEMTPLPNVTFIKGDFREEDIVAQIIENLEGAKADVIVSDMAPNISGIRSADQASAMYLAELTTELASRSLKSGGTVLVKVFQGEGFCEYLKVMRVLFGSVVIRKPKASRDTSREIYMLAKDYRGSVTNLGETF